MSSHDQVGLSPKEAFERLSEGNRRYLDAKSSSADISLQLRQQTCSFGQHPYAVVITCSDSRVIPEHIFLANIGDIFVIRVAGNVIDGHQLGSVEYALEHLGVRLVVVLGHTHCGAVEAAIQGGAQSYTKFLTDEIKEAIGDETDALRACILNVAHSRKRIQESLCPNAALPAFEVVGALYHIDTGEVEFLPFD